MSACTAKPHLPISVGGGGRPKKSVDVIGNWLWAQGRVCSISSGRAEQAQPFGSGIPNHTGTVGREVQGVVEVPHSENPEARGSRRQRGCVQLHPVLIRKHQTSVTINQHLQKSAISRQKGRAGVVSSNRGRVDVHFIPHVEWPKRRRKHRAVQSQLRTFSVWGKEKKKGKQMCVNRQEKSTPEGNAIGRTHAWQRFKRSKGVKLNGTPRV